MDDSSDSRFRTMHEFRCISRLRTDWVTFRPVMNCVGRNVNKNRYNFEIDGVKAIRNIFLLIIAHAHEENNRPTPIDWTEQNKREVIPVLCEQSIS